MLDNNTYLACAAVWDVVRPDDKPSMESRMRAALDRRQLAGEFFEKAPGSQAHLDLLRELQTQPTARPDEWVFHITPQGEIDIEFLLRLNDDPGARMESYQLTFGLTPMALRIDVEDRDPFDISSTKYFQLQLVQGDAMEYHIYFKDVLMTYNLRKTLMKVMHAASRFAFNVPQRTALLSTLQVLKLHTDPNSF